MDNRLEIILAAKDVTGKAFSRVKNQVVSLTKSVFSLNGAIVTLGGGGILGMAVSKFSSLEKGLIGVQKTTNMTDAEIEQLGISIEELNTRLEGAIPVTTGKLLEIAEAAGQLGVRGSENILVFTETIAKLENATDLIGGDAAKKLARLMNVTGESISNIDTLGSVIVALGNNMAATESEILSLATEVGQATSVFSVSAAEATAMAAAMKSIGVRAELGGSVVGRAMRTIEAAINQGGASFLYLQKITGMAGAELKKTFKENATQVFQAWLSGIGHLIKSGQSAESVLGRFGLKGEEILKVLPAMATKSGLLAQALNITNNEVSHATALTEESIRASKSFSAQMIMTINTVDKIAAKFGKELAPEIVKVSKEFRTWVDVNDDLIKQNIPVYIGKIGLAMDGLLIVGSAVNDVFKNIAINSAGAGMVAGGKMSLLDFLTSSTNEIKQKVLQFDLELGGVTKAIDKKTPGYDLYAADQAKIKPPPPVNPPPSVVPSSVSSYFSGQDSWHTILDDMNKKTAENLKIHEKFLSDKMDAEERFAQDYKRATMSSFDFERDQVTMQFEEYSKYVTDKIALMEWYGTEMKQITAQESAASESLKEIGTEAANEWSSAFQGWASSYSSTLTDMVFGAEASFDKILLSFGKMITQMMIQQTVLGPLMSGFGTMGSFFGSFLGFHGGGIVGSGEQSFTRPVYMGAMAGAPRLHGGLMPDEFPAILQKGEGVFTPKQMAAIGKQSGGENVTINIYAADARSFADMVERNPGPIIQVVNGALTGNTSLRHLIMEAT